MKPPRIFRGDVFRSDGISIIPRITFSNKVIVIEWLNKWVMISWV